MDKITLLKVIDLVNNHIAEIDSLPGQPIGKEQVKAELKLIINELKTEYNKK